MQKQKGSKESVIDIGTNVDDFLDDEPNVANSTETTTGNSDDLNLFLIPQNEQGIILRNAIQTILHFTLGGAFAVGA